MLNTEIASWCSEKRKTKTNDFLFWKRSFTKIRQGFVVVCNSEIIKLHVMVFDCCNPRLGADIQSNNMETVINIIKNRYQKSGLLNLSCSLEILHIVDLVCKCHLVYFSLNWDFNIIRWKAVQNPNTIRWLLLPCFRVQSRLLAVHSNGELNQEFSLPRRALL